MKRNLFEGFKLFTTYNFAIAALIALLIVQACNSGKQLCLQNEKSISEITNSLISYDKLDSIVDVVQILDSICKANSLQNVQLSDKLALKLDNGSTLIQSYAHVTKNDTLHVIIVECGKNDSFTIIYKKELVP